MRRLLRIAPYVLLAGTAALPSASALITLGHGRLVGSASARADYDSNIFVNSSQIDDYVATLTGDTHYVRDSGTVTLDVGIGFTGLVFADHDEQNTVDPFFETRLGYVPSDKTNLLGTVSYRRNSLANEIVNDRTQSIDFLFNASATHLTTEKLGFRVTTDYFDSNYQTPGYSDVLSYGFGLHGIHVYSPKLKLLAGVTRVESWTENRGPGRRSPANQDWRYTVGAEGELAPKVTGDVSVGVVQREFDGPGFDDSNDLYLLTRLTWAAAEKTSWSLIASRNLSLSAADQSVRAFNVSLNLMQALSEKLRFEGGVGFDRSSYVGFNGVGNREDRAYLVRGRLSYFLRENATLELSTGYRDNDSTIAVSDFDRFNLGAGIALRF